MKKYIIAIMVLGLLMVSIGFAESPVAAVEGDETTADAAEIEELEGPYIVTTCGQSPGAVMVAMSAMQAKVEAKSNNGMTADDIDAEAYKTLIVTTGTSMKGMGAAGTDVDSEIARCVKVIEAAKEAGLVVVGAHIEGMARRTDSSDDASINAVMELADVILVIDESDSDGFFTKYAQEHQKPLIKVKDALAVGTVL